MKRIQFKYNLIQIFFWFAICSLSGFAAIFLSDKGLSNTQIGTVMGGSSLLSVLASPFMAKACARFKTMSVQVFLMMLAVGSAGIYALIAYVNLPVSVIMVFYMAASCTLVSAVPLLSTISMEYIQQGNNLNFGLARGLGSIAYAGGALILSLLAQRFSPAVLSVVYVLCTLGFCLVLMLTPAVYAGAQKGEKTRFLAMIGYYPVYFLILCGMALVFACSTSLATYLINIIQAHGGGDTFYGIAVFVMAASEMPVMAAAAGLMKRFGAMKLIAAGAFFYILRNVLICVSPSLAVLLVGMVCQGFSYGLLLAVMTYYVSENLLPAHQVMGQTMMAVMTTGIGSTVGNVAGGIILDVFSLQVLFGLIIAFTITGSVIMMAGAALGLVKQRRVVRPMIG